MKIDGRLIATSIKTTLRDKITALKAGNITPALAIILIGNDPASIAYIRQKIKVGESLGIKIFTFQFSIFKPKEDLIKFINKLNADKSVHGIIIQRPVPIDITKDELDRLVIPAKDVDGFHPDSPFTPPIALAVEKILEWVFLQETTHNLQPTTCNFFSWLQRKKILVIGRGETGGKPIVDLLGERGVGYSVAHSRTRNTDELIHNSNIIISCVGEGYKNILRRDNDVKYLPVVRRENLQRGSIVIGVGLHSENGKLKADYNEDEIKDMAAYYTPVPGGVGPVNVACLFSNLILSFKLLKSLE